MSDRPTIKPDTVEIVCFWLGIALVFAGLWMLSPAFALLFFGLTLMTLSVCWYSIRKAEATHD